MVGVTRDILRRVVACVCSTVRRCKHNDANTVVVAASGLFGALFPDFRHG